LGIPSPSPDFSFQGLPPVRSEVVQAPRTDVASTDVVGPLEQLPGSWKGSGFNAIWRPHHPSSPQDRFLELNATHESLVFSKINGRIPNRGLMMPDILMSGVSYMQQVAEESSGAGLHLESGMWLDVPPTTNPAEPATVVRMASIGHGTVILAQGHANRLGGGSPYLPENSIVPFFVGSPAPDNSVGRTFSELDLSNPTPFRFASPGITQDMVTDPNRVLRAAIEGQSITDTTVLQVKTTHSPSASGIANTAFLANASDPPGGNAKAVAVEATFWIETVEGSDQPQLQYSQRVYLEFNGLRWPHVNVGTLRKV
jgi:hypothetical protein